MGSKRKRSSQNPPSAAPAAKKRQKLNGKSAPKPGTKSTKPSISLPLDASPFASDPRGDELKREVQLYDMLSSEDSDERLHAANAIVSGLLGGDGVEESALQRHLERRLFRGLASGRKGARLGYSVVITEILGQLFDADNLSSSKYSGLTFDKVLGFLIAKTKPDGDLSGQEEKDHKFGLLFGLQSFVRAKILFEKEGRWSAILEKLLELAKKKPWIREECGWVIVEALAQTNEDQARYTLEQLVEAGLAMSAEGVGIWLTAKTRFPDLKVSGKTWGKTGNPLDNLQSLAKALKESSTNDEGGSKGQQVKAGTWNPQLHFVWDLVLSQYASGNKGGSPDAFEHFWKVAVDDNLFSASASRERKYWGFQIFQKVLQDPKSFGKLYGSIFSQNLVRCIINHAQQEDRFLNRAADKSLKVLVQTVESNPEFLPVVLPQLIGNHGSYNFDKVTKTKTVDKLLSAINEDNAKSVVSILIAPSKVILSSEDETVIELRRLTLADYLLNTIRKVDVTDTSSPTTWVKQVALPAISNIAYVADSSFRPALSEKTRILFRNRLSSAFSHLLTELEASSYPSDLLQSFTPDAVPMDEQITVAKDKALLTLHKLKKRIHKTDDNKKAPLQALSLLYSLVLFQLYDGEAEALSILDELTICYDKLIKHKESDDEVEASEVLVELLLSFISKPSALLRKVSELVFAAFITELTDGGLKLMTDVLESGESLKGQQDLFDQEPDDVDDLDVDEGDELDSDVEVVDMDGDEGHLNGHLDESEDDENDVDEEEGKKLDEALAAALGTHKIDPDATEDTESDADMTDSEMMALDSKLVEIFSQRKKTPNKKQEQKDAKETIVNFKSRILDLLEVYVKKQATNPIAFGLLIPLLQLIRTTKAKHLANKSHNIILAFAKSFKTSKDSSGEINVAEQIKLLKALHLEAAKDPSNAFNKAASTASLLVASSVYKADKAGLKKITNVYRDSQLAWVEGQVKLQAAFFIEWVNWCQSHASNSNVGS